jgi:hypothetical protein
MWRQLEDVRPMLEGQSKNYKADGAPPLAQKYPQPQFVLKAPALKKD